MAMKRSESIKSLAAALAAAQGSFPTIERNKVGKISGQSASGKSYEYEYRYADLADIINQTRKPLTENKLSFSQTIGTKENGKNYLTSLLMHESGEFIEDEIEIPPYTKMQGLGSSISYLRRYTAGGMLGIVTESDDDAVVTDSQKPKQQNTTLKAEAKPIQKPVTPIAKDGKPLTENASGRTNDNAMKGNGLKTSAAEKKAKALSELPAILASTGWNEKSMNSFIADKFKLQSADQLNGSQYKEMVEYIKNNVEGMYGEIPF